MKAEFKAMDLAKQIIMVVEIKGMGKYRGRLFVAKWLIWLAALIVGFNLEIKEID